MSGASDEDETLRFKLGPRAGKAPSKSKSKSKSVRVCFLTTKSSDTNFRADTNFREFCRRLHYTLKNPVSLSRSGQLMISKSSDATCAPPRGGCRFTIACTAGTCLTS